MNNILIISLFLLGIIILFLTLFVLTDIVTGIIDCFDEFNKFMKEIFKSE